MEQIHKSSVYVKRRKMQLLRVYIPDIITETDITTCC